MSTCCISSIKEPFGAHYQNDVCFDLTDLPNRHEKMVALAMEEANNSDMLYHLGAVFSYNGSAVATGYNDKSRHRFNKQDVCSMHAELSVLWQVVPGTHQIKWYEKGP